MHLLVEEIDDLVGQPQAIGGDGEIDLLIKAFLQLPAITHHRPDGLHIHQGFAPEQVHLQVLPMAGMGDQKVQGFASHRRGHHAPGTVEFPRIRKAVTAAQVAIVGHMQAHGLDHLLPRLAFGRHGLRGVHTARRPQRLHFLHDLPDLPLRIGQGVYIPALFQGLHHRKGRLIHAVQRAALHVQDQVIVMKSKCVYQSGTSFFLLALGRRAGRPAVFFPPVDIRKHRRAKTPFGRFLMAAGPGTGTVACPIAKEKQ